jgi:shikimate dehydrogenase
LDIQTQTLAGPFRWQDAPDAQFAVIGQKIESSLSPAMHNAAFQAVGLTHRYLAIEVAPKQSGKALDRLRDAGYLGVNVTVPFKEEVLSWLTWVDVSAYHAQAANAVRLFDKGGFNTDISGFEQSLRDVEVDHARPALLLGAGGAARGVAVALAESFDKVYLWNRTADRLEVLAEIIGSKAKILNKPDPAECSLIVNATSASKLGQALPIDWENAWVDALAYDLFYSRDQTPFLKAAASHSLRTLDGLKMLVYQGADSWPVWGIEEAAPVDVMEKAVRDALRS